MSKKGDETVRFIIRSAKELFSEKGFKDVTMSDICAKTGLSRGGLYRHFASTEEIFGHIIAEDYPVQERILRGESALAILTDTLDHIEAALSDSRQSLCLAIYEYASSEAHREEFRNTAQNAKKRWVSLITYGISTGEFRNCDPEAAADLILYYYQGLQMWARVTGLSPRAASDYRKNIMTILKGGE